MKRSVTKSEFKNEFEESMSELALEMELKREIIISTIRDILDAMIESIYAETDYKIRNCFPRQVRKKNVNKKA